MDTSRLGIIFDGGGFHAVRSIGWMLAVQDRGLRPVYCQGVSAGAINAAKIVELGGPADTLEEIWYDIGKGGSQRVFPLRSIAGHVIGRSEGLFPNDGIKRLVEKLDCEKIVQSDIVLDVITYNNQTRRQDVFSNRDPIVKTDPEFLKKAILASGAIRGILPSVEIGGQRHSDGISFLIERAIRFGCTAVFIFLNNGREPISPNDAWYRQIISALHMMSDMIADEQIRHVEEVNRNLEVLGRERGRLATFFDEMHQMFAGKQPPQFSFEDKRPVPITVFRPPEAIPRTLETILFGKGDFEEAVAYCRRVGKRILNEALSRS